MNNNSTRKRKSVKIIHAYETHIKNIKNEIDHIRKKKEEYDSKWRQSIMERSKGYDYDGGDTSYWYKYVKYRDMEDKKRSQLQGVMRNYHRRVVDSLPLPPVAKKDITHIIRSFIGGKTRRLLPLHRRRRIFSVKQRVTR